jgi:hypothetical protein
MSQHAPGPWRAVFKGGIGYFNVNMDTPPHLTVVTHVRECDAKLIASAPELLEALELLTDWAEGVVRYGTVKGAALMPLENAKEIIKKARGESC